MQNKKTWFTQSFTEEEEEKWDKKRKRFLLLHVNEAAVENTDTHRPKLSGRDRTSPKIHGRDMTLIPKKIMIEKNTARLEGTQESCKRAPGEE